MFRKQIKICKFRKDCRKYGSDKCSYYHPLTDYMEFDPVYEQLPKAKGKAVIYYKLPKIKKQFCPRYETPKHIKILRVPYISCVFRRMPTDYGFTKVTPFCQRVAHCKKSIDDEPSIKGSSSLLYDFLKIDTDVCIPEYITKVIEGVHVKYKVILCSKIGSEEKILKRRLMLHPDKEFYVQQAHVWLGDIGRPSLDSDKDVPVGYISKDLKEYLSDEQYDISTYIQLKRYSFDWPTKEQFIGLIILFDQITIGCPKEFHEHIFGPGS